MKEVPNINLQSQSIHFFNLKHTNNFLVDQLCNVPKSDMHANPKNDMHENPKSDMHANPKSDMQTLKVTCMTSKHYLMMHAHN